MTTPRSTISFVNWGVFVYFAYIFFIWLLELADFTCFIFHWPQGTLLSRIFIAFLFAYLIILFWRRVKPQIYHVSFNSFLIVGLIFIAIFGTLKGVYPDTSFDTRNYHLLAQKPGFTNYFETGFAAGNIQIWGFRLADHLFSPWRTLLGFRLGTVFNTLILALIFVQLNQFLDFICRRFQVKSTILPSFFAFSLLLTEWNSILMIGTYYVDILAIPLLLELLRLLLTTTKKQINSTQIIYFATLCGFTFALKMTNIVYLLPLVILFILRFWQCVPIRTWIIAATTGIIPVSICLIFNYICTANPIFPYFNHFFRSPYYISYINFKDNRWGPQSFTESIFWLGHLILQPLDRVTEVPNPSRLLLTCSLLACIAISYYYLYLFVKRRQQIHSSPILWEIPFLFFSSYFLWSFTTGYARYYCFGWLLLSFSLFLLFLTISLHRISRTLFVAIFILITAYTIIKDYHMILSFGSGWNWTPFRFTTWRANISHLGHDRHFSRFDHSAFPDTFILPDSSITGEATLANSDATIYIANFDQYLDKPDTKSLFQQKINSALTANSYSIWRGPITSESNELNLFNQAHLYINSIESISSFLGETYLVTLEPAYGRTNTVLKLHNLSRTNINNLNSNVITVLARAETKQLDQNTVFRVFQNNKLIGETSVALNHFNFNYTQIPISPLDDSPFTLDVVSAGDVTIVNPH